MVKRHRGPMSKSERFYIDQNQSKLDVETLANDLNRTVLQVRKYLDKKHEETQNESIKKKNEESRMQQLMGGRDKGATVMTTAASELSDETKQKSAPYGKYQSAIHQIKPK